MSGLPEARAVSISTAGYEDGLGRRSVRFDREIGGMLECLHLRPELGAFEASLRERADAFAALDDERFVRIRTIARDAQGVVVVSELVPGQRLIDVIDSRQRDDSNGFGIDAAFGFLLQALPAVATLHAASIVHGTVAPGRMIVTPSSQIVLLDGIYAAALERLKLSRRALWSSLWLMAPPSAGAPRFDRQADVIQAVMCSLVLALGRQIEGSGDPASLVPLVQEVTELAEIRAGREFAEGVQQFLVATLPLLGRRPMLGTDEAATEVHRLAQIIGEEVSHTALADLVRFEPPARIAAAPVEEPAAVNPAWTSHRAEPVPLRLVESPQAVLRQPEPLAPEPATPEPHLLMEPVAAPAPPVPAPSAAAAPPSASPAPSAPPVSLTPPADSFTAPRDSFTPSPSPPPVSVTPPPAPPSLVSFTPPPPPLSVVPTPPAPASIPPAPPTTFAPVPPPPPLPPVPLAPAAPPVSITPTPPTTFAPVPPPPPLPLVPIAPAAPPVSFMPAPPPVSAPVPLPPIAIAVAATEPLRVRAEPPSGYTPVRTPSEGSPRALPFVDRVVAEPSRFPWKLAAVAVLVLAVGIVAGRSYLQRAPEASAAAAPAVETQAPAPPVVAERTGRLVIDSQPSGARVTMDGTDVGLTPLDLDAVDPGRHTLVIATETASVRRTVRVEAGKLLTLDVPVYSGWISVFAPISLEVAAGGKSVGSTETGKIMLPPGRHVLTLSNREFGFSETRTVEIHPGEERPLNVEPRGRVNINAHPWAEVWVDGRKAGETPIANLPVLLGTRVFIFKHPLYPDRRITVTITTTGAALSVDFTKR